MKLGFIHSPSGKSNCGSDSMITTAVNYSWMTLPHWMTLVQCHVQKLYLYNNNAKKLQFLQSPSQLVHCSVCVRYSPLIHHCGLIIATYLKSLNTRWASNTSRGSDLIVLIEAGPQIQAGFHKFAQLVNLLSKRLCTVHWAKHTVIGAYMLPAVMQMYY